MMKLGKIKKGVSVIKRLNQDQELGHLVEGLSDDYDSWLALIKGKKLQKLMAHLVNHQETRDLTNHLARNQKTAEMMAYLVGNVGARSLTQMLVGLMQNHPERTQYFEGIFRTWDNELNFTISKEFLYWLSNRSEEFRSILEELFSDNKLAPNLFDDLYQWESQLKFEKVRSQSLIRELYLAELFPNIGEIKIPVGVIHEESFHSNQVDMLYVCAIASFLQARQIFEFGTYRGQTTCGLAAIAADVKVTTLNLPPEKDPRYAPYIGQFIKTSPYRDRITQIFADAYEFDPSPYANQMDFIFIDADHSYKGVENDTKKALEMLRPGGVIIWHDYAAKSPGVYQFIRDFSKDRPVFRIRNTCLVVYWDGVDVNNFRPHPLPQSLERTEYSPGSA